VLGLLGHRVNSLPLPHFRERTSYETESGTAWGRLVTRRAVVFAPLSLIILIVLAIPVLFVDLGASDAGTYPKGQTSRIAYDQIATAFGPGFNGPLLVAVDQSADPSVTDDLAQAIAATDGVAAVQTPLVNDQGTTAALTVIPTTSPQSSDTEDLVKDLRDDVIPGVIGDKDASAYVGGVTAAFGDIASRIADRLGWFLLAVCGIVLLILMTSFRSVPVGVKTALTMLLSAMATFGVVIAVFQFGWGLELIGLDQTGPITSYLPPIVFAILFGLSMDYELFLVSRIREEYARGAGARPAIIRGMGAIGKVVVSAALIMATVFLSFLITDNSLVKEFGLALGVAVLIDAFIVRLTLVPAVMYLMGERMWWMPRWLDRVLPPLNIEPPMREESPARGDAPGG
jgi:RND superfamily putative drug exporter